MFCLPIHNIWHCNMYKHSICREKVHNWFSLFFLKKGFHTPSSPFTQPFNLYTQHVCIITMITFLHPGFPYNMFFHVKSRLYHSQKSTHIKVTSSNSHISVNAPTTTFLELIVILKNHIHLLDNYNLMSMKYTVVLELAKPYVLNQVEVDWPCLSKLNHSIQIELDYRIVTN